MRNAPLRQAGRSGDDETASRRSVTPARDNRRARDRQPCALCPLAGCGYPECRGFTLPPTPPEAELLAWAAGYLAGWARGEASARAEFADAELLDALRHALGPGRTLKEAAAWHVRELRRRGRRAAADRGEVR